jgi:hypothetical protein
MLLLSYINRKSLGALAACRVILHIVHLVSKTFLKITGFRLRLHACFVKGRNSAHAREKGNPRGE